MYTAEQTQVTNTFGQALRDNLSKPGLFQQYEQINALSKFRFRTFREYATTKSHYLEAESLRVLLGLSDRLKQPVTSIELAPNLATYLHRTRRLHAFPNVASTILEGFFVAQTLVDLQLLLKKRNSGAKQSSEYYRKTFPNVNCVWPRNPTPQTPMPYFSSDCTFVNAEELVANTSSKPPRLQTLLDNEKLLYPQAQNTSAERSSLPIFDPTRMVSLLRSISEMGTAPDLNFMTMVAVVNPLIPYGAAQAAKSTLQFAKSVSA